MAKSNWYESTRWKRVRAAVLRRDGYLCRVSIRYGHREAAALVHHIFPREQFPEYQYCMWNLISVTKSVHNSLHVRATDELSGEGIDLLRRTARKNGIEIPPQYA